MGVELMSRTLRVLESSDPDELEPMSRLLLVILSESAEGVYGYASPPLETLELMTGMKSRTLQRHLNLLARSGHISIQNNFVHGEFVPYIVHPKIEKRGRK